MNSNNKLTPSEQEEYEERAAILEVDGKMGRHEAETEAMRLVLAKRKQNAPAHS